jgi:hypothetical protein
MIRKGVKERVTRGARGGARRRGNTKSRGRIGRKGVVRRSK